MVTEESLQLLKNAGLLYWRIKLLSGSISSTQSSNTQCRFWNVKNLSKSGGFKRPWIFGTTRQKGYDALFHVDGVERPFSYLFGLTIYPELTWLRLLREGKITEHDIEGLTPMPLNNSAWISMPTSQSRPTMVGTDRLAEQKYFTQRIYLETLSL